MIELLSNKTIVILLIVASLPFVIGFIYAFLKSFAISFKTYLREGINKKTITKSFRESLKVSLSPINKTINRTSTEEHNIKKLLSELSKIIAKVDSETISLKTDIEARQNALIELINRNKELSKEETYLQKKIKQLKETPVEVVDYFKAINETILKKGSKRSLLINFIFFALGIIVSILIAKFIN